MERKSGITGSKASKCTKHMENYGAVNFASHYTSPTILHCACMLQAKQAAQVVNNGMGPKQMSEDDDDESGG